MENEEAKVFLHIAKMGDSKHAKNCELLISSIY